MGYLRPLFFLLFPLFSPARPPQPAARVFLRRLYSPQNLQSTYPPRLSSPKHPGASRLPPGLSLLFFPAYPKYSRLARSLFSSASEDKIGRASRRERGKISVGAGSL